MPDDRRNLTLQEGLLTLLGHDDEHGRIVAELVQPNLFEGDYGVIAERCIEYWHKYDEAPKAHIDDILSHILDDKDNRRAPTFRNILLAMMHLHEGINAKYMLDKLRAFVRIQELEGAIVDSAERLNKDEEVAVEVIEEVWRGLIKKTSVPFSPGIRLSDVDNLLKHVDREDEFATGIKELDQSHIVP